MEIDRERPMSGSRRRAVGATDTILVLCISGVEVIESAHAKVPWDGSATSSKQASKQAGAVNFHAPLQLSLPVGGPGVVSVAVLFLAISRCQSPPRIG